MISGIRVPETYILGLRYINKRANPILARSGDIFLGLGVGNSKIYLIYPEVLK